MVNHFHTASYTENPQISENSSYRYFFFDLHILFSEPICIIALKLGMLTKGINILCLVWVCPNKNSRWLPYATFIWKCVLPQYLFGSWDLFGLHLSFYISDKTVCGIVEKCGMLSKTYWIYIIAFHDNILIIII